MSVENQSEGGALRQFVANSPLGRKLGIELESVDKDRAGLRLPYDKSLATAGDVVHGGAIAALADTAATVACWSGVEVASVRSGATASLTIDYLAPAKGTGLTASSRVLRRGKSLCYCEVDVISDEGTLIAKALVSYSFSLVRSGSDRDDAAPG
jgi:uncharacterized protein (TIGR00369 family)